MKKTYIFITAALVLLISYSFVSSSNSADEPYLFLRVIECQGGDTANESMILIDNGDNNIEKIPLEKFTRKNFQDNFKIVSKTVNDIKAKGYIIVASSGGGGNDNAMIMQNYIFKKE